ncbi:MAG: zinc ribbon domain-containing protein [Thermodesulfatator sp.]|nr:MAG: zinc ribbon domain-containing protein [Thermodesulfatator sp.]
MPIYEFICNKCKKNFEDFVLSSQKIKEVKCPSCGSDDIQKQFSMFSCRSSSSLGGFSSGMSSPATPGGCGGSSGFS